MATNQLLRLGSKGSSVTDLQKSLNAQGYNLTADGIFGSKTQAAVKDYQKKNSLTVDGIVGNQTLTSLTGGTTKTTGSTQKAQSAATTKDFSYDDFSYDDYVESDTVAQAQAALNAAQAAKPGAYSSQWQAQIDDILASISGRKDFSYDVNGDALYQQYKDQYIQAGKTAMQDTMGQAAAMTGGYGNSYAAAVGNQAYQGYLQQLNDKVPELYQMAYDRYQQEGQDMLDLYALYSDQEDADYGRYRDSMNDYLTERDYAAGRYDAERSYDYSKYSDERNFAYGEYADDKSYAYDEYRNAIADEQWQQQYDESVRQYNEQMAFQKQQYEDSKKASSGSSSGGSSGGSSSGGSSGSGSGDKGTSGTNKTSGVSDSIKEKAASTETNEDLAAYLDGLAESGALSEEEADALYEENLKPSQVGLSQRTWTVVDKGGINWFGGIDNNGKVKDQYGNTYTLDKLVTALTSEGMSKSDAKAYVKKLQQRLGI